MDMKYTLKDNYLNKEDYNNLKRIMLGNDFPWYFQDEAVYKPQEWAHAFFNHNDGITSGFFNILKPILKKLDIKALIRVKANLYTNHGKIEEHKNHSDFPFPHQGALFALNTCNGFTMFSNNTKIKSIGNRILLFDPSNPHYSATCTDARIRCNININYF